MVEIAEKHDVEAGEGSHSSRDVVLPAAGGWGGAANASFDLCEERGADHADFVDD